MGIKHQIDFRFNKGRAFVSHFQNFSAGPSDEMIAINKELLMARLKEMGLDLDDKIYLITIVEMNKPKDLMLSKLIEPTGKAKENLDNLGVDPAKKEGEKTFVTTLSSDYESILLQDWLQETHPEVLEDFRRTDGPGWCLSDFVIAIYPHIYEEFSSGQDLEK